MFSYYPDYPQVASHCSPHLIISLDLITSRKTLSQSLVIWIHNIFSLSPLSLSEVAL